MDLAHQVIATVPLPENMTLQEIWHSILELGYHAQKAEIVNGVAHIIFGEQNSDNRIQQANKSDRKETERVELHTDDCAHSSGSATRIEK